MAEIVLQVVAMVLEGVEPLILDLSARPRGARKLGDVGGGGDQIGGPGILIGCKSRIERLEGVWCDSRTGWTPDGDKVSRAGR